ncbi:MAG: hypothetical protein O9257_11155 [Brevundimonas sp.]|jgi:crescentin|uniref:hypothetical protein n=1 Tax=Brevundimonas sp. TaxID=1871086 RepID=UPI0022C73024|nr:hypothetical protein [Brevundimonas sp.]
MLLSRIDRVLSGGAAKGGRGADPASPEGGQAARAEAAGVIGERFETIQDSLDQLGEMAQQFGRFESLLTQLRQPLEAEFKARRDNHVEVINLRAGNAELSGRLEEAVAELRSQGASLIQAETRADEAGAQASETAAALQDARLELDRLRNQLSQATNRIEAFEASERLTGQRQRELEQDLEGVRGQLKLAEAQRSESDSARIQLQRDYALALEEGGVMRRRAEEGAAEIAALARALAIGEGQLAAERARAAAEQAESARAIRALENQIEADRSELAALGARLDAATARANGLDVLNAEQGVRLAEVQAAATTAERRADTLQTQLDRALERVASLEATSEDGRQRLAAMDVARLAAVDRAEALAKSALTHDKAIARAEDRMLRLQAKLASTEAEYQGRVKALSEQITGLRGELEGARAEAAMNAAALDAARRERTGRPAADSQGGAG